MSVSIGNPAESNNPGMLAVGASSLAPTPAIRLTSSQGPVPNVTATPKPDVVGGNTDEDAGTSQSPPHVAGLAALAYEALATAYSTPAPTRVVGYLKANALNLSTPAPNNVWGHGFTRLPTLPPPPGDLVMRLDDGNVAVYYTASIWPASNSHYYQFQRRSASGNVATSSIATGQAAVIPQWEIADAYTNTTSTASVTIGGLASGRTYQVRGRRCANADYTICGNWNANW